MYVTKVQNVLFLEEITMVIALIAIVVIAGLVTWYAVTHSS
jgi:hypothetical protein